MNLPLDLIIQSATNLNLPLTSLLWIHSTFLPSQFDNTKLYSWNTILNYPSIVSESETPEFEEKRCKVEKTNDYSIKDLQLLNTVAVSNYLALKNPHAAMSITRDDQLEQQLHIQLQVKHLGFSSTYQMYSIYIFHQCRLHAYSSYYSKQSVEVSPLTELWRSRPWKALTQWKEVQDISKEEVIESLTDTIPGVLLQLEMQYPEDHVISRYEKVLGNLFHSILAEENFVAWHQYREYHELYFFLKDFSEQSNPTTSLEKQLFCNLLIMKMQTKKQLIETVVEVLVQQLASLQESTFGYLSQTQSYHFQEERERDMNALRYELEILRQFIVEHPDFSISKDHENLLLMELSKNLYYQGFTKLAISTMRYSFTAYFICRKVEDGSDSLVASTCRLEELKMTSMNEDESRKLVLIQAMCPILNDTMEEESDTDSMQIVDSNREEIRPVIAAICQQSMFTWVKSNRTFVL